MRLSTVLALILVALAATNRAEAAFLGVDFTGYVSSSTDASVPVGTALSGQLQLNYGVGDLVGGVVGSPSGWLIYNLGDQDIYGINISAGSYQYQTGELAPPGVMGYESIGQIEGGDDSLGAVEHLYENGGSPILEDTFSISNPVGYPPPYTSNGTPLFTSASSASGSFEDPYGNDVSYVVTSMTPVPIPPTLWLMLSGLGALGVARCRRLAA